MAQTWTEWRRLNSGTRADYAGYLAGLALAAEQANRPAAEAGTSGQRHLAAAEQALAEASERDPGDPEQLGLGVLSIAHAMTALLQDALKPASVPKPYTPETAMWNVIVRVRQTVTADTARIAIGILSASLRGQGFDPMDGPGDSYHSAERASASTWATAVSVVAVLRAESGAAARGQLTGALTAAHFLFDTRVQRGDWFLSEDLGEDQP